MTVEQNQEGFLTEMQRLLNILATTVEALKKIQDAFEGLSVQVNAYVIAWLGFELWCRGNLCAWIYSLTHWLGVAHWIAIHLPTWLLLRVPIRWLTWRDDLARMPDAD